MSYRNFIIVLSVFLLNGCIAGGYFINSQHPENCRYEEALNFSLRITVNAGSAKRAFKSAYFYYAVGNEKYLKVPMQIAYASDKEVIFKTIIQIKKGKIEKQYIRYYFEFTSDGIKSAYPFKNKVFSLPLID